MISYRKLKITAYLTCCLMALSVRVHAINNPIDTIPRFMAIHHQYSQMANDLLNSLSAQQKELLFHPFADTLRLKWQREPGQRNGLKLSDFTEPQKIMLHKLLRSGLSTQGYLKVTAEMFNEDIQKKFEPNLGRNEFWVEIFGTPSSTDLWGWKLEGHHLTVNFTLRGDKVIAHTPFLIGSNPANGKTDTARAGLLILNNEDELAADLVNSFTPDQLKKGYTTEKRHDIVYGEVDRKNIKVPEDGIYVTELRSDQRAMLRKLLEEYIKNFNPAEVPTADVILNEKARFFFMENRSAGKEYYYRIYNGTDLIECENYGNHIHCFWRSVNDFGKKVIK